MTMRQDIAIMEPISLPTQKRPSLSLQIYAPPRPVKIPHAEPLTRHAVLCDMTSNDASQL